MTPAPKINRDWRWFVGPGDIVFDVGANIGAKAALFRGRGARVVCIEPQPECVAALRKRYRWDRKVTIVPEGVADQPGTLELSICSAANTISTFSAQWKTGRFAEYKWDKTVPVPVTTLDALFTLHGVPAYCKIDVEGFEQTVLKGLTRPAPLLSFEFAREFFDTTRSCVQYLTKIGYRRFDFCLGEDPVFVNGGWLDAPGLFERIGQVTDPDMWGDIYAQHGDNTAGHEPVEPEETDVGLTLGQTIKKYLTPGRGAAAPRSR
jgi:FkbM family methyltransferase